MLDLPEMPDLDDSIQGEKEETPALGLPELPDFEAVKCGLSW